MSMFGNISAVTKSAGRRRTGSSKTAGYWFARAAEEILRPITGEFANETLHRMAVDYLASLHEDSEPVYWTEEDDGAAAENPRLNLMELSVGDYNPVATDAACPWGGLSTREVSSMLSREKSGNLKAPANMADFTRKALKRLLTEAEAIVTADDPQAAAKAQPAYEYLFGPEARYDPQGRRRDDVIVARIPRTMTDTEAKNAVKFAEASIERLRTVDPIEIASQFATNGDEE